MKKLITAALLAVTVAAPSAAFARPFTTANALPKAFTAPVKPAAPEPQAPVRAAAPAAPVQAPKNCYEAHLMARLERSRLELELGNSEPAGYGLEYQMWRDNKTFELSRQRMKAQFRANELGCF